MSLPHWEYYLAVEDDLLKCARYVEPETRNNYTYSLEFARIILVSCAEIDVVMKRLCLFIDSSQKPKTIDSYHPIINKRFPHFTETQMQIPRFRFSTTPWRQWQPRKPPSWWSAYNKVKHDRLNNFKEANMINAISSVMGLLALLLHFYDRCYQQEQYSDSYKIIPNLVFPCSNNISASGRLFTRSILPNCDTNGETST